MTKFRKWLINKLGGTVLTPAENPFALKAYEKNLVTIRADTFVNELELAQLEGETDVLSTMVKARLIRYISDNIVPKIRTEERPNGRIYIGTIEILSDYVKK